MLIHGHMNQRTIIMFPSLSTFNFSFSLSPLCEHFVCSSNAVYMGLLDG
jgi:hypothetical protein